MDTKICSHCNKVKDINAFYRDSRAADKHRGQCKLCSKAAAAEWVKSRPEEAKAYQAAWRAANRAKTSAASAAWRKRNPCAVIMQGKKRRVEKVKELAQASAKWKKKNPARNAAHTARWKHNNPAKVNASVTARRALLIGKTPSWANCFFIEEAYDLAQRRTKATGVKWHVDHIVPLRSPIVSGFHTDHNLQVLPAAKNQSKSNRYWPDMPEANNCVALNIPSNRENYHDQAL